MLIKSFIWQYEQNNTSTPFTLFTRSLHPRFHWCKVSNHMQDIKLAITIKMSNKCFFHKPHLQVFKESFQVLQSPNSLILIIVCPWPSMTHIYLQVTFPFFKVGFISHGCECSFLAFVTLPTCMFKGIIAHYILVFLYASIQERRFYLAICLVRSFKVGSSYNLQFQDVNVKSILASIATSLTQQQFKSPH